MRKIFTQIFLLGLNIKLPESAYLYLAQNPAYAARYFWGRYLPVFIYFAKRIRKDKKHLRPYLRHNDLQVAEIGCGMGALALFYLRQQENRRVFLIDRKIRQHDGIYSPLHKITHDFLCANKLHERFTLVDCDATDLTTQDFPTFDVILSLRALAYQFPLSQYSWLIEKFLKPGGCLITDVNRALPSFTTDWATLEKIGAVRVIYETLDKIRVVVKKHSIVL